MKNIFLLIVFVALFNQSFAQDCCKDKCEDLKHGIQFQVTNILNLTNYGGYTLAYRYQINRNSGLRIGIYTSVSNTDYDITQKFDSISINPPGNSDFLNLKFSLQYLHRIINYKDFDLLIGGGPFFSINNSESYSENLYGSDIRKYRQKNNSTGFGIDILTAVEYRLTQNVVFSGEYGINFISESTDVEEEIIYDYTINDNIQKDSGTVDRIAIRGSNVSLGLTIFF